MWDLASHNAQVPIVASAQELSIEISEYIIMISLLSITINQIYL